MTEVYRWREAPTAAFAVIGDPVGHSLSPRMHNAALAALGLSLRYVAIHVRAGEVGQAFEHLTRLGYRGVNVTVPHKAEAFQWLERPDSIASRLGAANTIRLSDRAGLNTDAPGFLDTLAIKPAQALVLGAGGSARAVVLALAGAGWKLRLYNRTRANAERLVEDLGIEADIVEAPILADASLVVNTTSASLQGDSLQLEWETASPQAVAYDLAYASGLTPFLEDANRHGLQTLDGRSLLVAQGARALEWWLDRPVPRDVMAEAIR